MLAQRIKQNTRPGFFSSGAGDNQECGNTKNEDPKMQRRYLLEVFFIVMEIYGRWTFGASFTWQWRKSE
jgi:hypothetical protein